MKQAPIETPFWAPNKHALAYASKLLIATGITTFYYFDPADPFRLLNPSEFIVDNRLLLSALALFLIYEGYKLYKELNTKPQEKDLTPSAEDKNKSWLTPEQSIALQAVVTTLTALAVFVYDHNMAMDNIELIIGTLALIASKLIYDLYVCYKKDKEPKERYEDQYVKNALESHKLPKDQESPSTHKLIAKDMLLTGAVLTICLVNHPKSIEILAENWEIEVAAGLILAGIAIAYVAYNAFNCGQERDSTLLNEKNLVTLDDDPATPEKPSKASGFDRNYPEETYEKNSDGQQDDDERSTTSTSTPEQNDHESDKDYSP